MLGRWDEWVDRNERTALGALVAFYFGIVGLQSSVKLLWVDELITFYISQQAGVTGIWDALRAGCDPNPPLLPILVQAATHLLGVNAAAMRLPSMFFVVLAILAMWWMLRRWVRPVFALAGVLAFMATRGFDYSYDARSYAPMMGFAMASLALWLRASGLEGWRHAVVLAGMAVALALGISSNYYCVLAFFPIAIGEIVARRWKPSVWLAMAIGSLPLIAYLPLIRHNIAEFGPHAWNRPQSSMIAMSYLELVEGIFWPVLGLGIWWVWKRKKGAAADATEVSPRREELAAIGVLLVYPFLGFAIAVAGAGMISPRCVAPVCCGIGLAAGLLASKVCRGSAKAGIAMVLGLVVWVGVREGVCAEVLLEQRRAFFALRDAVAESPGDEYVVGDSAFVLPLYFYSDDLIRLRIIFPIDFAAIHKFERDDSGEQNLWAGRGQVFPFRIGDFNDDRLYYCDAMPIVIARPDGWLAKSWPAKRMRLFGDTSDWGRVGGIFTPMAHEETRILIPQ